jgi:hypothetical protein
LLQAFIRLGSSSLNEPSFLALNFPSAPYLPFSTITFPKMSLQDSWQQHRQHRHQTLVQRQRVVQRSLTTHRQVRQQTATELRADLSLFREILANAETARQFSSQQAAIAREQVMDARRQSVQTCLSELSLLRQLRADELNQALSESRSQRLAATEATFQNLAEFRAELQQFRADLHQAVWGTSLPTSDQKSPKPSTKPVAATVPKAQRAKPASSFPAKDASQK